MSTWRSPLPICPLNECDPGTLSKLSRVTVVSPSIVSSCQVMEQSSRWNWLLSFKSITLSKCGLHWMRFNGPRCCHRIIWSWNFRIVRKGRVSKADDPAFTSLYIDLSYGMYFKGDITWGLDLEDLLAYIALELMWPGVLFHALGQEHSTDLEGVAWPRCISSSEADQLLVKLGFAMESDDTVVGQPNVTLHRFFLFCFWSWSEKSEIGKCSVGWFAVQLSEGKVK